MSDLMVDDMRVDVITNITAIINRNLLFSELLNQFVTDRPEWLTDNGHAYLFDLISEKMKSDAEWLEEINNALHEHFCSIKAE